MLEQETPEEFGKQTEQRYLVSCVCGLVVGMIEVEWNLGDDWLRALQEGDSEVFLLLVGKHDQCQQRNASRVSPFIDRIHILKIFEREEEHSGKCHHFMFTLIPFHSCGSNSNLYEFHIWQRRLQVQIKYNSSENKL